MMMNTSLGPPKQVRLRYKNPRYDRVVRINTETIARKMGFDEDQIFDITLAVEEAYANAIEHASRHGPDLELEIVYHLHGDRIVITVHDSGCGFDAPLNDGRGVPMAGIDCARGRGIALIRMLSDIAEIISEPGLGTLISITKYLKKPVSKPSKAAPKKKAPPRKQTRPAKKNARRTPKSRKREEQSAC